MKQKKMVFVFTMLFLLALLGCVGTVYTDRDDAGASAAAESVAATLSLSSTSKDFGSIYVGATSTESFTITNSGLDTAAEVYISLSGDSSFSLSSNNCGVDSSKVSLASGASCTFDVSLIPAATGALTGSVVLSYDDGSSVVASGSISLSGIGKTLNLEGLAVVSGARHIYSFKESAPYSDSGAGTPTSNITLTAGATILQSAAVSVTGAQGALKLNGNQDSGYLTVGSDWSRDTDRTFEIIFRITSTTGNQSVFMGPGAVGNANDWVADNLFAQLNTTNDPNFGVTAPGWNPVAVLDTSVNLFNKLIYLSIAYSANGTVSPSIAAKTQRIDFIAAGGALQTTTLSFASHGDPSSGYFIFGGNTGIGGTNITSLPSEIYHFATYDKILSASEIALRTQMLQLQ